MNVRIEAGTPEDIPDCVRIACATEIGKRYGFIPATMTRKIKERLEQGALLLVARESSETASHGILGFAWVEPAGAFGAAPHLKLIAVDQSIRSKGVGALLLNEFESRTQSYGRAWLLLVSDFNDRAIKFYEAHGYSIAGRLEQFVRPNIDELIMYKRHDA